MRMNKKKAAGYLTLLCVACFFSGCKKEESRVLDESKPIPEYDGSLTLESHYSRRLGIDVKVPQGMKVSEDAQKMTVKGDHYEVSFIPADNVELETMIADVSARKELEGYKDVDIREIKLLGHQAKAMIYNLKDGESTDHPAVYAVVDYEGKEISDADGLIITVSEDERADAYELLQDQKVLALLQNVEILEKGYLDPEQPLPSDDGSLELTEELCVENRLRLQIPEGFQLEKLEDELIVSNLDGFETLFIQTDREGLKNEKAILEEKYKDENYYHTEKIATTWQGYPADAYIYSVTEQAEDLPAFELVVDYGDSYVGGYQGLIIRSEYNGDLYAYDLLQNPGLLAVMNQAEVITGGKLDKAAPLPASDGSLGVAEFDATDIRLLLQIPEGMEAEQTNEQVIVTAEDGLKVTLQQMSGQNALDTVLQDFDSRVKEGVFSESAKAQVRIDEYKTTMQLFNRSSSQEGEMELVVDYGDTVVGSYSGLLVKVENDTPVFAYDYLEDQRVLTLLEKLDVIEGDTQVVYECNGITAEFPGRYNVSNSAGDQGLSAFYKADDEPCLYIQIGPGSGRIENVPLKKLERIFDDLKEITYGEEVCLWRYEEVGNEALHIYRPYGRFQTLDITLSMSQEGTKEWLEAVLEQPDFIATMESVTAMPKAEIDYVESEWDKRATDPTDFICKDGILTGYQGEEKRIVIPEFVNGSTVTELGSGLFSRSELISVEIPDTVSTIGEYCFKNSESLENVHFSENLTTIRESAFESCTALADILLPETVTTVGEGAFEYAGTGSFTCKGPAKYEDRALAHSGFSSVTFAEGSDLSAGSILANNEHLVSVNLGEGIEKIGDDFLAFDGAVAGLQIPESVKEIGSRALAYVGTNLSAQEQTITIRKDIKLAEEAFSVNYLYLKGVHTPEEFPEGFETCYANTQVYLCADASYSEMTAVDAYLKSLDHYDDVTFFNFEPGTFPILTTDDLLVDDRIVLGSISDQKEIVVGEFLESKDGNDYAIKIVGDEAFADSEITTLWIGPYIQEIWKGAFKNCKELKDIYTIATILNVYMEDDAFRGIAPDAVIHVPGRFTAEEKKKVEENFRNAGLPISVRFDYVTCE